jgi:hypothetical protein
MGGTGRSGQLSTGVKAMMLKIMAWVVGLSVVLGFLLMVFKM